MDNDLEQMDWLGLKTELIKLRNAVRYHRDQEGDDRCFLDDVNLYQTLPETEVVNTFLPPKREFLASCEKFYNCRQGIAVGRVSDLYDRTKFPYTSLKDGDYEDA